jgi:hypothetical protein
VNVPDVMTTRSAGVVLRLQQQAHDEQRGLS